MKRLNIIDHLINADQTVCPLISLEVEIGMSSHDNIRYLPSHYSRLSCKKILNFVGDDPDLLVESPLQRTYKPLNVIIYNLIDEGYGLGQIGKYLESKDLISVERPIKI